MQKLVTRLSIIVNALILSTITVSAAEQKGITGLLQTIWKAIIYVFSFQFLNNMGYSPETVFYAAIRFSLFFVVILVLYEIISHVGLHGRTAGILSFILAFISVIVIPTELLKTYVALYSGLMALVLLAIPLGVIIFITYIIPSTRTGYLIKAIILLVAFMLFSTIRENMEKIPAGFTRTI